MFYSTACSTLCTSIRPQKTVEGEQKNKDDDLEGRDLWSFSSTFKTYDNGERLPRKSKERGERFMNVQQK